MTVPSDSRPLSPEEVAEATGGTVIYYPPYHLDKRTMRTGYKVLRRTILWASRETGRPVPKTAQEVLRWLRDTFVQEPGFSSDPEPTNNSSKPEAT